MPSDRPDVTAVGGTDLTKEEVIRKLEYALETLRKPGADVTAGQAHIDREFREAYDESLERSVPETTVTDGGEIELVVEQESGLVAFEYEYEYEPQK